MSVVNSSLMIPDFYRPPAYLINPHTEQAGEETIDWLWRMGIIETKADETRIRGFQLNYWAGLTVHEVPFRRFLPYCKFTFYFTLLDDHLEGVDTVETVRLFRRQVVGILEGDPESRPAHSASPWVQAIADIWPQITSDLSERTKRRFAHFVLDTLACIEIEVLHRLTGATPTLAQYLPLRFNTVGMNYTPLAAQNALRLEIPDDLAEHYLLAEAHRCGADLVGWANDLESYRKEVQLGHTCNLVPVTAASEGCSLEQAADRIKNRIEERQRNLLDIENALPDLVSELGLPHEATLAATRFLDFLKSAFWAFVMFCDVSGRYQDVSEQIGVAASIQALRALHGGRATSAM